LKADIIRKKGEATAISLFVVTGVKKHEISGVDRWRKRLVVRVKEKPIEGRANKEIITLFSELFNVPSMTIRIANGEVSTKKTLLIDMNINEVSARLNSIIAKD
jgi:uncharacterized protein (TIGR00251 family)